jgi:glycosyltransferase involved in cell wall biosynthesis
MCSGRRRRDAPGVHAVRIMSVIASLAESGGAEMLARNLSLAYASRGHDCHVVYIADAASLNASRDFERGFIEQLDAAGIGYTMLGAGTRRNPLLGAWRLRRAVRAFGPDVLHIHLGWGMIFQALGMIRVPTVYTHHNIVLKFNPKLFRLFDRFVARYVAICAPCHALLARHVSRPIVDIANGVPPDRFEGTPRARVPHDLTALSVGNLTPQKDYPTLIAAARTVVDHFAARGRRVVFRIAGEGPERPALTAAIGAAGLDGAVELLGARRDVPRLMADADLMVQCSQFEGLPIALIEAAMSALPAIATDVGGCGEVVVPGETGLLVPLGDPEALAGAIVDALADDDRYARMSQAAKRRAGRYTLDECVQAHLRLYGEIADG